MALEIVNLLEPQAAQVTTESLNNVHVCNVCVVDNHVAILALDNGHGLLKKFWPMVIGCVLRTAGSSLILRPAYCVKTTLFLPHSDQD